MGNNVYILLSNFENLKLSGPNFGLNMKVCESRDSSVGTATGYGLDDKGVRIPSPGRDKNFHFSMSFRPALGPHLLLSNVYGVLFPWG
jgi:hypothetical protein